MSMITFDQIDRVRFALNETKRMTRTQLMRFLGLCYSMALSPMEDGLEKRLYEGIRQVRVFAGQNPVFAIDKDPLSLVTRFVFSSVRERSRSNVSRYVGALRVLADQGVQPDELLDAIKEQGGLTALYYQSRDTGQTTLIRAKLNLNTTIKVQKNRVYNLKFKLTVTGNADVLELTEVTKEKVDV